MVGDSVVRINCTCIPSLTHMVFGCGDGGGDGVGDGGGDGDGGGGDGDGGDGDGDGDGGDAAACHANLCLWLHEAAIRQELGPRR